MSRASANGRVKVRLSSCLSFLFALAGPALAQVPDVITYDVGVNGSNTNDIHYWGQANGIAAYSIATQSCNAGTQPVDWISSGTHHPVIAQNMFRLENGSFEHIGQSWLKHGFCAVNEIESECGPCQSTPCESLGIGCADTYWATLNDGQDGQSKRLVNAATGTHVHGGGPTGNGTIRGRLQVAVADIDPAQNPGAEYFIEGQYVTADDGAAGVSANNASWRRVNVLSVSNVVGGGPTDRGAPAIYAWQSLDSGVEIKVVQNVEGSGIKTNFYLGFRVTDLGHGRWHYEYAIQNLNSDQSASSYSVPVDPAALITRIGFHDVAYHSGDPYDPTDWSGARSGGEVRWASVPFGTNTNANALRWGTLYNFRFDANLPPGRAPVTIGLFKPSLSTNIEVDDVLVPMGEIVRHDLPYGQPVPPPITTPRNGGKKNPFGLVESEPARVGEEWRAALELEGVSRSFLLVGRRGPTEGLFTPMGEILVQAPTLGASGNLAFRIPDDPRLVGLGFSVQALVRRNGRWQLTNALDVTIGGAR